MKLRIAAPLLALTLSAAAARADTFNIAFTPTGGSTVSFTTQNGPGYSIPNDFALYYVGNNNVFFYTDSESNFYQQQLGYGHIDFEIAYNVGGTGVYTDTLFDGPTLFTGATSNPQFIAGTYLLTGDAKAGTNVNGTLVITNLTPTPEPSSLALLGTGALGVFGVARRRFGRG